jgi:hypothetical protein
MSAANGCAVWSIGLGVMTRKRYEWHQIGRRFACDRNTAARRWENAMEKIVEKLMSDEK